MGSTVRTNGGTAQWSRRGAAYRPSRSSSSKPASCTLRTRPASGRSRSTTTRWPPRRSSCCSGGNRRCVIILHMACARTSLPWQRKCWWDGIEVDVAEPGEPSKVIKLWARRVWTLELSLVRTSLSPFPLLCCSSARSLRLIVLLLVDRYDGGSCGHSWFCTRWIPYSYSRILDVRYHDACPDADSVTRIRLHGAAATIQISELPGAWNVIQGNNTSRASVHPIVHVLRWCAAHMAVFLSCTFKRRMSELYEHLSFRTSAGGIPPDDNPVVGHRDVSWISRAIAWEYLRITVIPIFNAELTSVRTYKSLFSTLFLASDSLQSGPSESWVDLHTTPPKHCDETRLKNRTCIRIPPTHSHTLTHLHAHARTSSMALDFDLEELVNVEQTWVQSRFFSQVRFVSL